MAGLRIEQIPVLRDNYVYLLRDDATAACAAVDPSVAAPVLAALGRLGWSLTHVFNTHHHHDHTGGNLDLKAATGCTIVGHGRDAGRIPGIDVAVEDGQEVALGTARARVFDVSGHTIGHIAYWFEADGALFCGDTLFSLGCGRLFEGTPARMWASLTRLRELPGETRVYCGHEYTESNARFALSIDPANPALRRRAKEVRARRAQGLPTVPSLLADERAANPFLRADDPLLQTAAGLASRDPIEAFAEIRRRKDAF
ncbi:MAG TPA: hydroxyacylglutathione hydrolase [Rhodospirillales bacterium]|nr:hydroxyacylglutathione hydrolase [Rhodospirillales bacterium]